MYSCKTQETKRTLLGTELSYNEKEILSQTAKGDEGAFGKLISTYHVGIYHAVYHLTGDRMLAEEVVQDLFLKVWLKRTSLPEIVNFPAWINTIAENMALNAIKQSLRKKNDIKDWVMDFYRAVNDTDITENYLMELLQEAVQQLSPRQRETYLLIKEQGYHRNEAALKMNISPETVKTHLEQALRNVRAYCMARLDRSAIFVIASFAAKNYF